MSGNIPNGGAVSIMMNYELSPSVGVEHRRPPAMEASTRIMQIECFKVL